MLEDEDLIAEESVIVTVSHDGYIKRMPIDTYKRQGRGGRGIIGSDTKEGDFIKHLFVASTHDYLLIFTNRGRCYWLQVYDVPSLTAPEQGPQHRQPAEPGQPADRLDHQRQQLRRGQGRGAGPRAGHGDEERPGQEDPPQPVQQSARHGRDRDQPRSERRGDRRRADLGRRPHHSRHPRRHDDPVRRAASPLDGPGLARRARHQAAAERRGGRHGRPDGKGVAVHRLRERLRQTDRRRELPLADARRRRTQEHQDQRPQRQGGRPRSRCSRATI